MKCQAARDQMVDALKEGPSIELENHLRECADCRSMLADFTSVASVLHEMPDVQPTPHVFNSVKRQMTLGQVRSGRLRKMFRMTFAAVALAGLVWVGLVLGTSTSPRVVAYVFRTAQGADYVPGQGLSVNREYDFASYTSLTVTEVGVVRVREGSQIRFVSANEIVLDKGEVFVEVSRKPKDGFRVRTEKFTASVVGTEFGVSASDVYVMSGQVKVDAGAHSVKLGAGELVHVNGGALAPTRVDPVSRMIWVREYEPPTVNLQLVSNRRLHLVKPETVLLRLTNSSRFWPAYLRNLESGANYLRMKLVSKDKKQEFTINLDHIKIAKARYEDRLFRIEAGEPVEVEVTLRPEHFESSGKSGIFFASFVYTSGVDPDSRIWSGTVESRDTIEIEIRK